MEKQTCKIHSVEKHQPECRRCLGEGEIEDSDDSVFSLRPQMERCFSCRGSGNSPWLICELCEEDEMANEYFSDESEQFPNRQGG
jgi:DnaJ-class molecular chaperone